jgi:hypothetical protein
MSWRQMFPEIALGAPGADDDKDEYVSEEDDDYMPDPEAEIASDDQRSVHTESAEDSDSSDDGDDEEEEQDGHDEQDSDDGAGRARPRSGASSGGA